MSQRSQTCPVCRATYAHLPQHLVKFHGVANPDEKKLLLQLSSGRIKATFKCAVPHCTARVKRLDRHNAEVHMDMEAHILQAYVSEAKTKHIMNELSSLRASKPTIPLATFLDVGSPLATSTPADPVPSTSFAVPVPSPSVPGTSTQSDSVVFVPETQFTPGTCTTELVVSEESMQPSCSDPTCIMEKKEMEKKILELQSQLRFGTDDCKNPVCQLKSAELSRYVQKFVMSPTIKLRKKFSRRDSFRRGENPKYEKLLQRFADFCSGCNPSMKKKDNVNTCVSHVRRFLIHAGEGRLLKGDFIFLRDSTCISSWVKALQEDNLKPTTVRIHLLNTKKFLTYMLHLSQKETKLSGMDYRRLLLELDTRLKDLATQVTTHRQKVRKSISKHIVPKDKSKVFRKEVQKLLPRKIKQLKENPQWDILEQVFGLLSGYFICVSGHRRGVLQNMLVKEVEEADVEGENTVIEVSSHKSASTYGYAQLSLKQEEYSWFMELLEVRKEMPGGDSVYFFFNRSGGMCKRLLELFQREWIKMGFGGKYTFRNLRTSLVHYTKNISPKKREKIHRAMCHSEAVASRFYTTLNTASEAAAVRKLQEYDSTSPAPTPSPSPVTTRKRKRPDSASPQARRALFALSSSSSEQSIAEEKEEKEEEEEEHPFVLVSPSKAPKHPSGFHLIGEDPSAGHGYFGRPILINESDMPLLEAKGSPRVKLVRVDQRRAARPLPTESESDSDSHKLEESQVLDE
ncbi:hypothetical protein AMEX_G12775 [Astyanax mexicanus]|uniref:Uncharacterized protein n=1 Tax=Astyanax mexicanus TaxID=7994 RepID=A0A8T2LRZ7_ASTMX|nr:hypothetical protein AMEX_G12771 [Astyanax mexicanus]KAG9273597.1 hypothetical protein AMEX_G12775 [Astyanax mexicanus]